MARKPKESGDGNGLSPLVLAVRQATKPASGTPLACAPSDLPQALRFATAICLDLKATDDGDATDKVELSFDKATLPPGFMIRLDDRSLAEKRIVANRAKLFLAVRMLGTHGGKVPDARLGPACAWPPSSVTVGTRDVPGVHSGNVRSSHPLSGAGNAAMNSHMRFLCMGIVVSTGDVVSLAGLIAGQLPEREALLDGLSPMALETLELVGHECVRRMENGMPGKVDAQRSQVFLPVDGGYVAASPLYPLCIGAELHVRLRDRGRGEDGQEEGRQSFRNRTVHVGGTKPQNTGLLATYIRGRFPRLVGMPPMEFAMDGGDVVRRFLHSGLLPASGAIPSDAVDAFFAAFATRTLRNNSGNHVALLEATGDLCDAVLSNVSLIAREDGLRVVRDGTRLLDGAEPHAGSRDIALILGMLDESAEERDVERVALEVASRIGKRLHGRKPWAGRPSFVVDADIEDMLVAVAVQKIQEFA